MSREQFFKPDATEKLPTEESVIPEKPADWEIVKAKHLAAKEAFHQARAEATRTGKEKYLTNKYRKHIESTDKLSM